jgi:hypothetical protein
MTYRKLESEFSSRSDNEIKVAADLRQILMESIEGMGPKWDIHLPVFLSAPSLARLLWLDQVYRLAINVPGCLVEFGSQWGASLNTFLLLKQIHEPWNASRRIVSFSLFEDGFNSVDPKDGPEVAVGDYRVSGKWDHNLRDVLTNHSLRSPLGPEQNFEIIPGDACETFSAYLEAHPELILSHVHFDMDLYVPTRDILNLCLSRMPIGAVLIFDEINCPSFPGETLALQEVLGVSNLALRKSSYQPYSVYAVVGS